MPGGGTVSPGDGGLATNVFLDSPQGVAVDINGNIYIPERSGNIIRKVDAQTGIITTIAGTYGLQGYAGDNGPATSAILYWPMHICIDNRRNNLFIADSYNHRVRKVNLTTGIITTVAGTGLAGFNGDGIPATTASLSYPVGVCVDSSGNVYITDEYRLRKIDVSDSNIYTLAGSTTFSYTGDNGPASQATFNAPDGIAFDKREKNLYIADDGNTVIRAINMSTGIITTFAGNGTPGFSGDTGPAIAAEINYPTGVCVNPDGDIIIADQANNRLRKVTMGSSINENSSKFDLRIWPNPANNFLYLEGYSDSISILDILGKEVLYIYAKGRTTQIDINDIPAGIYFIRLKSSESTLTKKIVIQH